MPDDRCFTEAANDVVLLVTEYLHLEECLALRRTCRHFNRLKMSLHTTGRVRSSRLVKTISSPSKWIQGLLSVFVDNVNMSFPEWFQPRVLDLSVDQGWGMSKLHQQRRLTDLRILLTGCHNWDPHVFQLASCSIFPKLTSIKILGPGVGQKMIAGLDRIPTLKSIYLTNISLPSRLDCANLSQLEMLNISSVWKVNYIPKITNIQSLRSLSLAIPDHEERIAIALKGAEHLDSLDIISNHLTTELFLSILSCSGLGYLRLVVMEKEPQTWTSLTALPRLESLSLSINNRSLFPSRGNSIKSMVTITPLKSLVSLVIDTPKMLFSHPARFFPQLKRLTIHNSEIVVLQAGKLDLTKLDKLESLYLRNITGDWRVLHVPINLKVLQVVDCKMLSLVQGVPKDAAIFVSGVSRVRID